MIGTRVRRGLAVAVVAGMAATGALAAANELTPAQTLLFDTDQLKNLPQASIVRYRFHKDGALEPGFDDAAELTVGALGPDGRRDLDVRFLTPPRGLDFEPFKQFRGNPLVMLFLERDVREMKRLTGGSDLYFRNRIRHALARPDTEVRPVTVDWQGNKVPATEVVIHPYVADELIERYRKFEHKEYRIIVSEAVPGMLYAARAMTPAADGGPPLTDDRMILEGAAP
ncbi:hypothetical protein [Azospirillum sp. TSO22-1]|uniref:hypothetical protein n=1 Tax=Azospirillum sp. TSO22-1 TaxID=716789 RepID=UPI000D61BCFD|nr:hypothetical protein [Azospirillum sp. TSO22-1]PWC35382.1 hypothetical protein TSO221_29955 [Azospirillum sp. TSO22-1]